MVDSGPLIDAPDRERGILAPADRKYLDNPEEYQDRKTRQAAYNRRNEIPGRIRNSLLDMSILAHPQFPEDFLEEAFSVSEEKVDEQEGPWARLVQRGDVDEPLVDDKVEDAVVDAITFFHRMYPPSLFNEIIEEGVKQAVDYYYPDHEVVDASYEPEIRRQGAAHKRAKQAFEKGRRLTDEQIRILLKGDDVDPEEVATHVREQPDSPQNTSFVEWSSEVGELKKPPFSEDE